MIVYLGVPIVSSTIVEDHAQVDGRRSVRERHVDHLGKIAFVDYLAEAGANVDTMLATRAALIETAAIEQEINENLQAALSTQAPVLQFLYSTVAANRQRLREVYKKLTKFQVVRMGWFIHSLNLTDTQLKNIFGVNDAGLVTLKTRLLAQRDKYNAIQTEVGE